MGCDAAVASTVIVGSLVAVVLLERHRRAINEITASIEYTGTLQSSLLRGELDTVRTQLGDLNARVMAGIAVPEFIVPRGRKAREMERAAYEQFLARPKLMLSIFETLDDDTELTLVLFHRPVVEDDLGEGAVWTAQYRHTKLWRHPRDENRPIAHGRARLSDDNPWVDVRLLLLQDRCEIRGLLDGAEVRM